MNLKQKLAPSVMCCDLTNMKPQLELFEKTGIDLLHIDIMDGHFVPNMTFGLDFVRQLKKATSIPLDVHMMVESPEKWIDSLGLGEGDYISIHQESTCHLQRTLQMAKKTGAKVLLALNPGTPLCMAEDVLDDIDGLLIMTVNPGFAGQKLIPHSYEKIRLARAFLDANEHPEAEIEVDGNVSVENALRMRDAGANIYVAGTSGVFFGDVPANIAHFQNTVLNCK